MMESADAPPSAVAAGARRWAGPDAAPLPSVRGNDGVVSAWMVTFTDLVGLLLTFFIMLFAMSNPDPVEWERLSTAMSLSFNPDPTAVDSQPVAERNIETVDLGEGLNLDYLAAVLRQDTSGHERLEQMVMTPQSDRLVVSLPADLLFETNSAELTTAGAEALFELGGSLAQIRNELEVIGHTDPRPIRSGPHPTNWELSLARAASVADGLRSSGYYRPLLVQGVGESRHQELSDRLTDEQRQALGRRVDIVVRGHASNM